MSQLSWVLLAYRKRVSAPKLRAALVCLNVIFCGFLHGARALGQQKELRVAAAADLQPVMPALQAAYEKGNISMTPGPGGLKLVIHNYVKPDDSMTLTINKEQKALQSIQIASYMDGPSDGMNLTVRFDRLPDGTNHVSSTTVEGVSKQLTVATQNGNYQKR